MRESNEQQPIIKGSSTADSVQSTWIEVAQATTHRALYRALEAHKEALGVHLVVISALMGSIKPGNDPVPHPTPSPSDN